MNLSSTSFDPIPGYHRIKMVGSFEELVRTPWRDGVNALCWPRQLKGDFEEIVTRIGPVAEITGLDEEDLRSLDLSPAGRIARDTLIADLRRLTDQNLAPNLDCIPVYPRDDETSPMPIDVYGWHVDSAPILSDTYLCSYTVAASEGLQNEEATRCEQVSEIRAALLERFGGVDDEEFKAYLSEHFYDLHYVANAGARPFGFGLGNLWRIANACPGSPVPPCIHRAPMTQVGQPPRLLLIS